MSNVLTLHPADMARVGKMIKDVRTTNLLISTFQTADYTVIVQRDSDFNVDVHLIFET